MVALIALLFGLSEAGRGLGMNASDALFFLRFGVDRLPWMYMGLGLLTFGGMIGYALGLARYSWTFLRALYISVAGLLVIERLLVPADFSWIYPTLWLTVNVVAWVLFTTAWSVAGQVFDTRQAKRLFSIFASASIFGGIVGNALTGTLADALGTENLYFVYAGLLVINFLVVQRIAAGLPQGASADRSGKGPLDDLLTGVRTLKHSKLLQLITAASVLFSVLFFSVAFPFSKVVSASFPNEAAVAGFLGTFTSFVMFSTFLVSLFLASRIYAWIGIVNVILIVPLVYLAGFGLWTISFTLVTAALLRYAHMVWINGAGNSAWNALFNVFHSEKREQLRAFESGVPAQFGIALSGVLLLLGERTLTNQEIFLLGGATAIVCAGLCWRMRLAYGEALLEAIRSGVVDVFSGATEGLAVLSSDAQARRTAVATLSDPRPVMRKVAAQALGRMGSSEAVDPLVEALEDPSPEVRGAAARALGEIGNGAGSEALKAAVSDPDPDVRQASLDALCMLKTPVGDWVDPAFEDHVPRVRASAAAYLHTVTDQARGLNELVQYVEQGDQEEQLVALHVVTRHSVQLPIETLQAACRSPYPRVREAAVRAVGLHSSEAAGDLALSRLADDDERVRNAAADAAREAGVDEHRLLVRLETGSRHTQLAALRALEGANPEGRHELLEWTVDQLPRLRELRAEVAALDGHGADGASGATEFLRALLDRRRDQFTHLILEALCVLGDEQTMQLVSRGLGSDEREVRSQALEALETLGDRRVVNGFLPLIEEAPEQEELPVLEKLLTELADDRDPWIRGLALYLQVRRGSEDLGHLRSKVEGEGSDIVGVLWRDAQRMGGGAMTETVDTLSTMERILCLRQVPAFRELDPDDLHRIADIAEEVWIPEGDYLCREGDIDDELYVIVKGDVLVTKRDDEGNEKELRTLGEGDHVGELAIICRQPRSATVKAYQGDVQTLMISGRAFDSILRDRPEVSRAMLASLARRLSTQV